MSALDQALTKAYAKTGNASAARATAASTATAPVRRAPITAPATPAGSTIERIYHDGTLYRVESAVSAKSAAARIQPPHLKMLPPTSPRRSIRRSLQRLAASQAIVNAADLQDAPPRIARKVIIRHISHPAAPPPLGLLRATGSATYIPAAELPPEVISDEPLPTVAPPKPDTAPLNIAVETASSFEIHSDWDHAAGFAPLMLINSLDEAESPWAVVSVELDALARIEELAKIEAAARLASATAAAIAASTAADESFTAKSLDDSEEPRVRFRIDASHSPIQAGPHAKFSTSVADDDAAPETSEPEHSAAEPTTDNVSETTVSAKVAASPTDVTAEVPPPAESDNLTFAELAPEPLASDLIPPEETRHAEVTVESTQSKRPAAAPLWEVDRFHWPKTCEKLFADEKGYLSQAGDRLLAAVQDGLRVLAITGTRRGEGRTTLALCLARAAAQAGVHVAVMDADFARPQLASKIALEVTYGWQDVALGRIPLSEAAIQSIHDGVTVLPLESALVTRGLSLADPRVTATIRAAAATFDLLILDLGPIGAGEHLAFPPGEGSPLDAAIVVRDLRFATVTESGALCEVLQDAGIEAVGIAENFVVEEEIPATSV